MNLMKQTVPEFGKLSEGQLPELRLVSNGWKRERAGRIMNQVTGVSGQESDVSYQCDNLWRHLSALTISTGSMNLTEYSYTLAGDLTSVSSVVSVVNYDYDSFGNLLSADLNGTNITYTIDAKNRRIGKSVDGTPVQKFIYKDQLNPVAELDGSDNIVAEFVYAEKGNVPSYMLKGGEMYRIISDHLGSVRLVVNATDGAVAQRIDYDEFGIVLLDTNPGFQPFGFAGGLYDRHTGLVRFGARDYDPSIGRWTTKDEVRFAGGMNLYAYCGNNPVNFDPLGLYWFRQPWQPPGVVGRDKTIVPPGGPVSEFVERYLPAGYTFGQMHDSFVGWATMAGFPDWRVNKPSMYPMYWAAVAVEMLRAFEKLPQPSPPEEATPCK